MLEFVMNIIEFVLKVGFLAVAIGLLAAFVVGLFRRGRVDELGNIFVVNLNEHQEELRNTVLQSVLDKKQFKDIQKQEKKKRDIATEKKVYILDFHGDLAATAVTQLREMVTVLLQVAQKEDEILIRLESSGGIVHDYGLAAAQLVRLKEAGFHITVCVDKVAASGGYMMAAVAQQIVAAPFAMIGSIGILVMMPNFHRLLKKHDIDYLEMTAGEYKTTLTPMGEITEKGLNKSQEELDTTHELFKEWVKTYRPTLDVEAISTGEVWYGSDALKKNLIDQLATSDEVLMRLAETRQLYRVDYEISRSVRERLAGAISQATEQTVLRLWSRLEEQKRVRFR